MSRAYCFDGDRAPDAVLGKNSEKNMTFEKVLVFKAKTGIVVDLQLRVIIDYEI